MRLTETLGYVLRWSAPEKLLEGAKLTANYKVYDDAVKIIGLRKEIRMGFSLFAFSIAGTLYAGAKVNEYEDRGNRRLKRKWAIILISTSASAIAAIVFTAIKFKQLKSVY